MIALLKQNERKLVWLAIAGLAVFALVIFASVQSVGGRLAELSAAIEKPTVRVTMMPSVPAAAKDTWLKASVDRISDPRTEVWLTGRIQNVGYDSVGEVITSFSAVGEIREIHAYAAEGHKLGDRWYGPEISAGGKGTSAVSVKFPPLDPGEEHWLFLGLDSPAAATLTAAKDTGRGAGDPRLNWKSLTVAAKKSPFDEAVVSTIYGWAPTVDFSASQAKGGKDSG